MLRIGNVIVFQVFCQLSHLDFLKGVLEMRGINSMTLP
jgi:hypothetical protein